MVIKVVGVHIELVHTRLVVRGRGGTVVLKLYSTGNIYLVECTLLEALTLYSETQEPLTFL